MSWVKRELPGRLRRRDDVATAQNLDPDSFPPYFWPPVVLGLASGLLPLLMALAISLVSGLGREYVDAWPLLVLASFGIAWSVAWFLWSASNVPVILLRSRSAFTNDERFDKAARGWAREVRFVSPLAIAMVAALLATYVGYATHNLDRIYGVPEVRGAWTDPPEIWPKSLILGVWAFAAAVALVPNLFGAAIYLRFVRRVGLPRRRDVSLAFVDSPSVARDGFRALALFGLIGGVAWTIASGTWAFAAALNGIRWDELVPVAAMTLIGIALLVVPQITFRQKLVRIRHARVDAEKKTAAPDMEDAVRKLYADTTWPHGGAIAGALALAAQILIPVATTLTTNYLKPAEKSKPNAAIEKDASRTPQNALRAYDAAVWPGRGSSRPVSGGPTGIGESGRR